MVRSEMSVALIQFSALDLGKFLPIGREALDRSLSAAADASGKSPPLHHIMCMAAMKDSSLRIKAEACAPYLSMFHAGFAIGADERDCAEILEAAGMPSIMVESVQRGLNIVVLAGTLTQWRAAILRGSQAETRAAVRHVFNQVYSKFKTLGLAPMFDLKSTPNSDQTYVLSER
jgi:hypothetical protein